MFIFSLTVLIVLWDEVGREVPGAGNCGRLVCIGLKGLQDMTGLE